MVETPKTIEELVRLRIVHPLTPGKPARVREGLLYRGDGFPEHRMDVYLPAEAPSPPPAVMLVHGGPGPRMGARRLGVFLSYGELIASRGLAAAVFDHGFTAPERLPAAADDAVAALAFVRSRGGELGLDGERLAFWVFSGGGPLLSIALRDETPYLRALVSFYAALDLREPSESAPSPLDEEQRRELSPLHRLGRARSVAPLLIARAGLDTPALNATVDRFVAAALARNAPIDLLNHATGRHGFDILDDCARSRDIIARAVEFVKGQLEALA